DALGRWPDRIAADVATSDPVAALGDLARRGTPPEILRDVATRPPVVIQPRFLEVQPTTSRLGDARAAVMVAHGAMRLFFTYFDVVGDRIDDRLLEVLGSIGTAAPAPVQGIYDALRRFGEALHDGHVYIEYYSDSPQRSGGLLPVYTAEVGGEPVVVRSNA